VGGRPCPRRNPRRFAFACPVRAFSINDDDDDKLRPRPCPPSDAEPSPAAWTMRADVSTHTDGASTPSLTASSESPSEASLSLGAEPDDPRPLPPLPPLPRPSDAKPPPPPPPGPRPRPRSTAIAIPAARSPFASLAKEPRALARLLAHLRWADFRALAATSKAHRRLFFAAPAPRHAVLARFVPGYRRALAQGDARRLRDVPIEMGDLERFSVYPSLLALFSLPCHFHCVTAR
jgi:hypothetical protein